MSRTYRLTGGQTRMIDQIKLHRGYQKGTYELAMHDTERRDMFLCELKLLLGVVKRNYVVTVEQQEVKMKRKMTGSQWVFILLVLLTGFVGLGGIFTAIEYYPDYANFAEFMNVEGAVDLGMAAVGSIVLVLYILLFYVIPDHILKRYIWEIDSRTFRSSDGFKAVSHPTEAGEGYQEQKPAYIYNAAKENPHPPLVAYPLEKSYRKQNRLIALGRVLLWILSTGMIWYLRKNLILSDALSYFAAVTIFLVGCNAVLARITQARTVASALEHARPYDAVVTNVMRSPKSKARHILTYEFTGDDGTVQETGSAFVEILPKGENEATIIGKGRRVWLAPGYLHGVLAGEDPEDVKKKVWPARVRVVIGVVFAMALVCAVVGFRNNPLADPVGKSLEVEFADTYQDDGLTQADIDSDTVKWICNTYAVNVQYEEESGAQFHMVGMFENPEQYRSSVQKYLKEFWGITDRKSAINVFRRVLRHGSRQKYPAIVSELNKESWLKKDMGTYELMDHYPDTESLQYWGAYQAQANFKEQGIDAWDYCRVMRICGLSYVAGYINLTECLDQCLPIAKHLQKEYESFDDLAYSYAYGYEFWAKKKDELYTGEDFEFAAYELCLERDYGDGPFVLDYNTELKKSW